MPNEIILTAKELKLLENGDIKGWNKLVADKRNEFGNDTTFIIKDLDLTGKNFLEKPVIDFTNTKFINSTIRDCTFQANLSGEFISENNYKDAAFSGNIVMCNSTICLKVSEKIKFSSNNFFGFTPDIWSDNTKTEQAIKKDLEGNRLKLKDISCEDGPNRNGKIIKDFFYVSPALPKSSDMSVSIGSTIDKDSKMFADITHFPYATNILNRFTLGSTLSINNYGDHLQKFAMTPISLATYLGVNREGQDSYMTTITAAPYLQH